MQPPATRPFTTSTLVGSADIQSIQAFYGSIATIDDALILIEAVRRRKAPRVHHRLTEDEQLAIGSGSVFIWNEEEAQIKRWTDGRHWSNSRMKGRFFLYKELSASKKTGTTRGRVAIAAVAAAAAAAASGLGSNASQSTPAVTLTSNAQGHADNSPPSADDSDAAREPLIVAEEDKLDDFDHGRRAAKASKKRQAVEEESLDRLFLRKKTISVRTRKNERYHLVAYYYEHEEASLTRPSQVPRFAELAIEPGFYLTGLDSTPLMVANQPAASSAPVIGLALAATASATATSTGEVLRPASPISHGHLPSDSGIDSRHAASVSRTTSYLANNPEPPLRAPYGASYPAMPPPRRPGPAVVPPFPSTYTQSWPMHAPSTADPRLHYAPGDYCYDPFQASYPPSAAYHRDWPSGASEYRDRDYPTYDRPRRPIYGADRTLAARAADPPSNIESIHSPLSSVHGHPTPMSGDHDHRDTPASWESTPSAAQMESGYYPRHTIRSGAYPHPPSSARIAPPVAHPGSGYYYPPTPTSYGLSEPFGYYTPPAPHGSISGSASYPYPGYPAVGAPAFPMMPSTTVYLDPSAAPSRYPPSPSQLPYIPRGTRPVGSDYSALEPLAGHGAHDADQ